MRDFEELYTNRALAHLKLEDYKNVIVDCDWALRVNENSVKAMIHKGKALTHLKDFNGALSEFKMAKKIKPSPVIDGITFFFEFEKNDFGLKIQC